MVIIYVCNRNNLKLYIFTASRHSFISKPSHKPGNMKAAALLFLLLCITSCDARTITVDPSGRGDAVTLNSAILKAGPGDTIRIMPGNYPAPILDRSLEISGAGQAVIEGSTRVAAANCRISGLTFKSSGSQPAVMIDGRNASLSGCSITAAATALRISAENCSLQECRIDSPNGLEVYAAGCTIRNSSIKAEAAARINRTERSRISGCNISALQGVLVEESGNCSVLNNSFAGDGFAVVLRGSHDNSVSGNDISGGYISSLDVEGGQGNTLTENRIQGGKIGISLRRSMNSLVSGNAIERAERAAVFLDDSSQNLLQSNRLIQSGNGILLQGSNHNSLLSNEAFANTYGISLRGSPKNLLRDSLLHNNSYNLRLSGRDGMYSPIYFDQDIDASNLVDGKPVCYLVGASGIQVPSDCGFLGLVSCQQIRAQDIALANSSAGILLVNCSDCSIQNSSVRYAESGYLLAGSRSCTIEQSLAEQCLTGFAATASSTCQIVAAAAVNCSSEGILADDCSGLGLLQCRIEDGAAGAALKGSRLCRIRDCSALRNRGDGFSLLKSNNCSLIGNEAILNENGIILIASNSCILQANNASGNERDGISLQQLEGAEVLNNTATGNAQGIYIQSCRLFRLQGNELAENSRYGLRMSMCRQGIITGNHIHDNSLAGANLVDCSSNDIYRNVFANNGLQNAADNGENRWDGGPELGGNYWSDHSDGGEPRLVAGGGVDRYPFSDAWGWL